MSLAQQLSQDVKTAMKARDKTRLSVVRMLLAELQKAEISKRDSLSAEEELSAVTRMAKQRRESIVAFEDAGRTELAEQEKAELKILQTYLPEQLSKEEVIEMVKKIIGEVGASSKSDMGKVMGKLMPQLKGKFPGKEVRPIVDALLDA
jgi:uncharacterized protein YqeY